MSENVLGHVGKYELKAHIGSGASGTVYLALDTFTRNEVALKVLDRSVLSDPFRGKSVQNQFLNEASLAGKLSHPHIASILEAVVDDDIAYVAMEYVPGGNLLAFTKELIAVEKAVEIGFKCCGALDYAWRQGIIHRDIKPANILVVRDTHIKIADFGAALLVTSDRAQIADIGSPGYMSPEQLACRPLTFQSDMFSLGVVLYELFTGRRPFPGDARTDLVNKILNEGPAPVSYLRPELPTEIDTLLMSALAKRPEERYPSWADFALELAKIGRLSVFEQRILDSRKFEYLRSMAMLQRFNDPEIWELVQASRWSRVPPRTTLVQEHQPGGTLFFLAQGEVKVTKLGRLLNILRAGECFGEMGYIKAGAAPRQATVETLTEVVVAELGVADIEARIGAITNSKLMFALLNTLVDRLAFADQRIARVVS
jgi:serine/threonine protein kinase